MKLKFIKILSVCLLFSVFSCSDDDVETEYIIGDLAGRWVVTESCSEGEYGPYELTIYNTAFNSSDSLYIDNIYDNGLVVIAKRDGNKFSVSDGPDVGIEGLSYTISGEVFNKDSIAYTITLMDGGEAFDECTVTGHRFTGFE